MPGFRAATHPKQPFSTVRVLPLVPNAEQVFAWHLFLALKEMMTFEYCLSHSDTARVLARAQNTLIAFSIYWSSTILLNITLLEKLLSWPLLK